MRRRSDYVRCVEEVRSGKQTVRLPRGYDRLTVLSRRAFGPSLIEYRESTEFAVVMMLFHSVLVSAIVAGLAIPYWYGAGVSIVSLLWEGPLAIGAVLMCRSIVRLWMQHAVCVIVSPERQVSIALNRYDQREDFNFREVEVFTAKATIFVPRSSPSNLHVLVLMTDHMIVFLESESDESKLRERVREFAEMTKLHVGRREVVFWGRQRLFM